MSLKNGGEVPLSLEVIEEAASGLIGDLEREALQTIRRKDSERGKACLDEIEGATKLLEVLRMRANSSYYRQLRVAEEARAQVQHNLEVVKRRAGYRAGKGSR